MGSDMSISVGLLFLGKCFATNSAYKWSLFLTMSRDVPHEFLMTGKGMMTARMYTLFTDHCDLQPWLMSILTTFTANGARARRPFPVQIARLVAPPGFVLSGCPALKLKVELHSNK